jgi:hypothetical protein
MINARAVPALPAQHRRIVSPVSPFKDFADPLGDLGSGFGMLNPLPGIAPFAFPNLNTQIILILVSP